MIKKTHKYALMVVKNETDEKINIGDYIQALAAKQFVGDTDVYIERETDLKAYDGEPVKMIMNGWYMNHTENWPPSPKIQPLYVALHINKSGLPGFVREESIRYFKQHEPIGCRDTNSAEILQEKGVDAYFSGCLTLTLGRNYKSERKSGKVYIVEPHCVKSISFRREKLLSLKLITFLLCHWGDVKKIAAKKKDKGKYALINNAYYLMTFSKRFDYKMLVEAEYINQYNYDIIKEYPTNKKLMEYAEELVKKYAEASCVITSRIHCALPCLGIETPVIYVENTRDNIYSTMRFGGLKDLFNVMVWDGKKLSGLECGYKINTQNFPRNKETWKKYANSLINKCVDFVQH